MLLDTATTGLCGPGGADLVEAAARTLALPARLDLPRHRAALRGPRQVGPQAAPAWDPGDVRRHAATGSGGVPEVTGWLGPR